MEIDQLVKHWTTRIGAKHLPKNLHESLGETVNILKDHYPDLAAGKPDQKLTETDTLNCVVCLGRKTSTSGLRRRLYTFVLILERGREDLGWDVIIPSLPATTRREPGAAPVFLDTDLG